MKKITFFFTLLAFSSLLAVEEKERFAQRDPIYFFIQWDEENKGPSIPITLTDPMIELLKLDGLYDANDSFSQVVRKTQNQWLAVVQGRKMQGSACAATSTEKTDLADSSENLAVRDKVEKVVRSMGLFDQRNPAYVDYDYGAWLGAFLDGVRNNLQSLVKAWEKGSRFKKLVVFTGERYLRKEDGQEDDIRKLCDPKQSPLPFKEGWQLPKNARYETEYDMMRLVFDQVQLPHDMEEALNGNVEFVNAPKGQNLRPGTKDCYVEWLKTNPEPGTLLSASYPLLWVAQEIAGRSVLGERYPLDTIVPALSQEEYEKRKSALVVLVHDTFAKCLYEINLRLRDAAEHNNCCDGGSICSKDVGMQAHTVSP